MVWLCFHYRIPPAIAHMDIGQDGKALLDYTTAIKLDPNLEKDRGGLLKASRHVRQFKEIIENIYPIIVSVDAHNSAVKAGLGFFWSAEGMIVTNTSVLGGAKNAVIRTASGEEFEAGIVGQDKQTNLAVLKVKNGTSFSWAQLSKKQMRVGDVVLVGGSSYFNSSPMVPGIIHSNNHDILLDDSKGFQIQEFVSRHSKLGPVFNSQGELAGMLIGYMVHNTTIKSAISANAISGIVRQLIKYGEVRRGWLGVSIQTVSQDIAESLGLEDTIGVLVSNVASDGPAARAQIMQVDVILSIDGHPIKKIHDLSRIVSAMPPGKWAEVVVIRKGKKISINVSVGLLK